MNPLCDMTSPMGWCTSTHAAKGSDAAMNRCWQTIYEENRQKAPHFRGGMNAVLR